MRYIRQVGEVLEVNGEDILLHCSIGGMAHSGAWRALVKRQGRTSAPWTVGIGEKIECPI